MMTFLINVENWEWSDIYIITAVGYTVVFLVLVLLIYVYKLLPVILNFNKKKSSASGLVRVKGEKEAFVPGEVNAAIGMSLLLYFNEQHEDESNVITIKRVARTYSPWSSKIYGVRNVLSR
jgi:Na+-transporting methylmalonyl-CoA/oxaloacetate decarboxylase gamma subunit